MGFSEAGKANRALKRSAYHAQFATGGYSTEAGIAEMPNGMATDRFKVAAAFVEWQDEFMGYHRKDALIVKTNDVLLSATRIGVMQIRPAKGCKAPGEWPAFLSLLMPAATPNLRPRYNIAPTTPIDVVINRGRGRELVQMRWGLIPGWWNKSAKEVGATFNARGEEVADLLLVIFASSSKRNSCNGPAAEAVIF